jgi:hypothetical protein
MTDVTVLLRDIPKGVRFGAHTYSITKQVIPDHKDSWATIDIHKHEVTIETRTPNGAKLAESVIHEFLHGIWNERQLAATAKEEDAVQHLACGLVALFLDNPWLLRWLTKALR